MNGILDEFNGTASLRLQMAGQYPYLPGSYNLNLLNDSKFQPAAEMKTQKSPEDFHVNGSFEAPKPGYDSTPCGWASTPGSCAVTMFDDHLYSQVSFFLVSGLNKQISNFFSPYISHGSSMN
jgi:hypothetical protein